MHDAPPATTAPDHGGASLTQALWWVLGCFVASRAMLLVVGLLSRWAFSPYMQEFYYWYMDPRPWLDMWVAWDSEWYLDIIRNGYQQFIAAGEGGGPPPEQSVAFFPLYPLLVWMLDQLLGDVILSGVLVANACALGAMWLLYVYGREAWGEVQARAAAAVMAFYPNSFIFSCMYTESLFLLLLLGMLVAAQRDRWLLVGVLGALLSATRVLGVSAGLGFLVLYYVQKRRQEPEGLRWTWRDARVLWLLLFPLGLLGYMWHLHVAAGNAFAFADVQPGFMRVFQWPWDGIWYAFASGYTDNIYMGCVLLFTLTLLVGLARLGRWAELVLALPFLVAPLFTGDQYKPLVAIARYTLVIAPLYGVLGWLAVRHHKMLWLLLLMLATLNGMLMACWATGVNLVI